MRGREREEDVIIPPTLDSFPLCVRSNIRMSGRIATHVRHCNRCNHDGSLGRFIPTVYCYFGSEDMNLKR